MNRFRFYLIPFLLLILLFNFFQEADAQNYYKDLTLRNRQMTVGIGPSMAYTDFSMESDLPSVLHPSLFISYSQKFASHIDLVTTMGTQLAESNHIYISADELRPFVNSDQSITYKNLSLFMDVMPQFNFWRSDTHVWRPKFNAYAGLGIGLMTSSGVEQYLNSNRTEINSEGDFDRSYPRVNRVAGYIPFRIGINRKIHPHWDLGLQGTYMALLTDSFDGNNMLNGKNDGLLQVHLTLKRYLPPAFAPFICY